MSKSKKITTIVIACIFAVLGIFVTFWYFGVSYSDFYARATKEFEIPGLSEGFTPQGLCHADKEKVFLVCGYMKDGSASRIYVVDEKTEKMTKYFTLNTEDGAYTGHAGGIATDGTNVWIAGDGTVNRFSFEEAMNVENGNSVQIFDSFVSNNGADFVTVDRTKNNLWVGEFHREGKYDTDESHFIETSDGTINKAISFCYEINNDGTCGITSTTPIMALSTPSLVQGMSFTTEKIVISTSYSLPNSHIYSYTNIMEQTSIAEKTFKYNDTTEIPLFVLENKILIEDLEAPCMSEEIEFVNGKIYVLFESACQKYGFVTREPLRNVFSFAI